MRIPELTAGIQPTLVAGAPNTIENTPAEGESDFLTLIRQMTRPSASADGNAASAIATEAAPKMSPMPLVPIDLQSASEIVGPENESAACVGGPGNADSKLQAETDAENLEKNPPDELKVAAHSVLPMPLHTLAAVVPFQPLQSASQQNSRDEANTSIPADLDCPEQAVSPSPIPNDEPGDGPAGISAPDFAASAIAAQAKGAFRSPALLLAEADGQAANRLDASPSGAATNLESRDDTPAVTEPSSRRVMQEAASGSIGNASVPDTAPESIGTANQPVKSMALGSCGGDGSGKWAIAAFAGGIPDEAPSGIPLSANTWLNGARTVERDPIQSESGRFPKDPDGEIVAAVPAFKLSSGDTNIRKATAWDVGNAALPDPASTRVSSIDGAIQSRATSSVQEMPQTLECPAILDVNPIGTESGDAGKNIDPVVGEGVKADFSEPARVSAGDSAHQSLTSSPIDPGDDGFSTSGVVWAGLRLAADSFRGQLVTAAQTRTTGKSEPDGQHAGEAVPSKQSTEVTDVTASRRLNSPQTSREILDFEPGIFAGMIKETGSSQSAAPKESTAGKQSAPQVLPGKENSQPAECIARGESRSAVPQAAQSAGSDKTILGPAHPAKLNPTGAGETAQAAFTGVSSIADPKPAAAALNVVQTRSSRPDEFVLQLADRIFGQIRAGEGEIRIQLRPEHLGNLEIRAENGAGGIVARIAAESTNVKQFLESNLHTLQTSLQEQGLKVDRIDVVLQQGWDPRQSGSTYQQQSGQTGNGQAGAQSSGNGHGSRDQSSATPDGQSLDAAAASILGPDSTFHTIA